MTLMPAARVEMGSVAIPFVTGAEFNELPLVKNVTAPVGEIGRASCRERVLVAV